MAEIGCESCGRGYYDTEPNCPHCAAPAGVPQDPRPKYRRIGWCLKGAGVGVFVLSVATKFEPLLYPAFLLFLAGTFLICAAALSLRGIDD